MATYIASYDPVPHSPCICYAIDCILVPLAVKILSSHYKVGGDFCLSPCM